MPTVLEKVLGTMGTPAGFLVAPLQTGHTVDQDTASLPYERYDTFA